MVPAVATLCLVAGLLEGAFSLSCYHCSGAGNDCTTNEKACDKPTDKCISTVTEISTQGKGVTKSVVRACGNKEMCGENYSMSQNATNLYAIIRCCDKDKCSPSPLDIVKSTAKNDLECPTCNEAGEKCKNPIQTKCTGEEKKCASYTAKDAKAKYIAQVCATENMCTMSNITTLPYDQILLTKFDCNNYAPCLLPGLAFPVAIVITMLKLVS